MGLSAPVRPALDRRLAEAADLVTVALDELLPRGEGGEGRRGGVRDMRWRGGGRVTSEAPRRVKVPTTPHEPHKRV